MAFTTTQIVLGSLFIASKAFEIKQQQSAQSQQKKQFEQSSALTREANAKQQQIADLQSVRARRAAAREAQIRKAEVISAGEQRGGSGSSSVVGSAASLTTQAGANVSFLDESGQLGSQAATLFGQAQEVAGRPIQINPIAGAVSSLAGTVFSGVASSPSGGDSLFSRINNFKFGSGDSTA